MPRYDYKCENHGQVELDLSIAASDRPQYCGHCGETMTKLPSAPGVHFKGGCWAYDGYSGNNPQGVKERT